MRNPLSLQRGLAALVGLVAMLCTTAAWAVTPTVLWQKTTTSHQFSTDGSSVIVTTATGFEVRRTSDGVLQNTVTLPTPSLAYRAYALSPDKTLIGVALTNQNIEIWRVSNATLLRSITSGAARDIKWIALSNTLVATMERFGYGSGGMLRVHNISSGALVKSVQAIRNSSPVTMLFSPNGQYLGYPDHFSVSGLVVLRTSDWSTALTVGGTTLFGWANDSGSLWTGDYRRLRVPDGAVLQTIPDHPDTVIQAFTPNNQFFLADVFVNFQYTNMVKFLRSSDASVRVTYTFPNATAAYAGGISSGGTVFSYTICPADCTTYFATVPPL